MTISIVLARNGMSRKETYVKVTAQEGEHTPGFGTLYIVDGSPLSRFTGNMQLVEPAEGVTGILLHFKRVEGSKSYVKVSPVSTEQIAGFGTLYIKPTSPLAIRTEFDLIAVLPNA